MTDKHVHDEAILMRTVDGQRVAFDETSFDAPRRRLLLMVNGFTPLASLTARLDPQHDWHSTARALLDQKLISIDDTTAAD